MRKTERDSPEGYTCPIIDGRIVNDRTFALRFLNFIESTDTCDFIGDEEKRYLSGVARKLLDWQIRTATDKAERDYLENAGYKL